MELFNYTDDKMEPQKGDLLISEPFLMDPNFVRTVVLLCEHNSEGSFGFVLNRPSRFKLSEVLTEVKNVDLEVYVGGPVQVDTLHFIHREGGLLEGGAEVRDGLYWGGNFEQVKAMASDNFVRDQNFKFFMGYSGWSAGQLMDEMKLNSWIISRNVGIEQVFDKDPQKLWKDVLIKMGGKFKVISNFPVDPRLN